jgi:simple sugar transport system ATP-binding protein
MSHIYKAYPGVQANDDVSLEVSQGEVLCLIGENGAGKSTIMNILYGLETPDAGEIKLFGKTARIDSPSQAIHAGIGMVHQHFMLMRNMTVLRNIILGQTPARMGFLKVIDEKEAALGINAIMEEYDLPVNLNERIYQLSVGEKQRVEIIKALYRNAKILILDEPTAVLTPIETDRIMDVLRRLRDKGTAIIFITHKLREVMRVSDRITVMRKGRVTGNLTAREAHMDILSDLMVGRKVDLDIAREPRRPGSPVLKLHNISAKNQRGLDALKKVNFEVRAGEIVGIAGVEGNGQSELVEVISGMMAPTGGYIEFNGEDITGRSVRKRREQGVSHIPEDRLRLGVAVSCSIRDNLILNRYYQKPFAAMRVMNNKALINFSKKQCEAFDIKTPDPSFGLGTLSGGNMQKVVLAREMEMNPQLLIAAQPTRGVDIGAIEAIHRRIIAARDAGKSVLLVSAELDEILSLSDRVLVMFEGEIMAEFSREEATEQKLAVYMLGAKRQGDTAP